LESAPRGGKHRADYSDAVTGATDPDDPAVEQTLEPPDTLEPADAAEADTLEPADTAAADAKTDEPKKRGALREAAILVTIAVVLYYVMLTFVARPYLIPSESMEPTLHGCSGCTGDRIMVDKLTYRFGSPRPGDVIVTKANRLTELPPALGYDLLYSKHGIVLARIRA